VSVPGGPDDAEAGQYRAPAGLLEKLMAAVRPEFRAGVLTFDPRDPVFGGPPCAVPGCERPARIRNLCWGHRQRWHQAGKPDLAQFTASTSPDWAGHRPLSACAVPGCGYCHCARGLCQLHHQQWGKAGRPGISGWLTALDYAPPSPPDACAVPGCGRWAMPATPFCHTHYQSWRRAGRPEPGEFAAARADPGLGCEWIDVRCLPGRLRLEIQYVLQCRGDERQSRLRPVTVQQILRDLAATGAASLLERTEEEWAEPGPRGISARGGRQFTLDARARIEQLAFGSGWEVEYPRDKWRLRNLGIQPGKEVAAIDFAPIGQPWLAALAKRWCRWRLSAGLSAGEAAQGVRVLRRFSAFLAAHAPGGGPASIDRTLLERYLADLAASLSPSSCQGHVSALSGFLRDTRRHGWDDGSLPATAVFYPEDYPKLGQRLPRAVAAHVMGQPRLPADHHDPDPLRAADLQRRQPSLGLRRHRRRRRPLPALLQHQDETRGPRAHRRRAPRHDQRPARPRPPPVAGRHPRAVPPAADEPGRNPAGRRLHLPGSPLLLAGRLRHPRRARATGPSNPPSMASHSGNGPDQPRCPAACRAENYLITTRRS
jgi:hypothetical protein